MGLHFTLRLDHCQRKEYCKFSFLGSVPAGWTRGNAIALIWAQTLCCWALVARALGVHEVSHLESQTPPGGQLFGAQLATNFEFDLDSHPHLCCLGGCEIVDSLVDRVFIDRLGIERLGEGNLSFAQLPVGRLAFGLVLFEDRADALALFGRQLKLIDGIFDWGRCGVLRVGGAGRCDEQERGE